jgi:hypothetical protein
MKKSPLNRFGRGQSKVGITKDIINRVNTMWADRTRDSRTQDVPSFQTAVQGDVSDNVIQSAPETPLADPLTNPGASAAAENMFGATIPGSFDRSMGAPEEEIV